MSGEHLGYNKTYRPNQDVWGDQPVFIHSKITTHHDFPLVIGVSHWLLLILFAIPPSLWLRARYAQRRDKKLFEEAVASKRAEQQNLKSETEH